MKEKVKDFINKQYEGLSREDIIRLNLLLIIISLIYTILFLLILLVG